MNNITPAETLQPRVLRCASGDITATIGDRFSHRDLTWEIVGFGSELHAYPTHEGEQPNVRCKFSGEKPPAGLDRHVVLGNCIDFCGDSVAAMLLTEADGKMRDARGFVLRAVGQENSDAHVLAIREASNDNPRAAER